MIGNLPTLVVLYHIYIIVSINKKYASKWNFREEEYSNVILTDAIEVIIIELSKFEKYKNNTALASWVKFINNPKVIDMGNKEIRKAKKVLDELSQNEHERRLAELREKYIMDQKATEAAGYDQGLEDGKKLGIETGVELGKKQGIEIGTEQGRKQGIITAKIQIAKEMKSQGYENNTIQKLTGLSIEEIENL